jgi:broad specificity phosphatase PhoE
MNTIIYLVRHGEVNNPKQIFYGRLPGFSLSGIGRKEAHRLGNFLAGKTLSAIYASPLERAMETASIIASYQNNVSVVPDKRLLEVKSLVQGKTFKELGHDWLNFYTPKYTKLGSEKLSDVWNRMASMMQDIVINHKGREIAVVTHGDPVMISVIKHLGRPLRIREIRGQDYIMTGGGYRFVFNDFRALEVSKLDFSP